MQKAEEIKPKTPIIRKKKGTISKTTQKAMQLVTEHGVDHKTALELAKGRPVTPGAVSLFKEKARKFQLASPSMVKLAHGVVKDALQGKAQEYKQQKFDSKTGQVVEFVEVVAPSVTNKLAAASMVLDRDQPLKGSQESGPRSFTQINVQVFANGSDEFSRGKLSADVVAAFSQVTDKPIE